MHSIFFAPRAGSARSSVHASCKRPAAAGSFRFQKQSALWTALAAALCCTLIPFLSGCGSVVAGASSQLTGTLVASANALSFGSVPVGQSMTGVVSVKNESADPVQISQVNVSGQAFSLMSSDSYPVTVAGGGTYSVNVKFQPSAAGAATGSLTMMSNATSGNPTVTLSGTGTATTTGSTPGAMISPTPGSTLSGSSTTFTWSAGSGVTGYELWLGSTGAGSQNLGTFTDGAATGSTVSQSVTGLPTSGATLYVRLLSQIGGNWQATDYTYVEFSSTTTPPPAAPTVIGLSCSSADITGSGSDSCTVTLSGAAGSGGVAVSVTSTVTALSVPASVTVAANATTATFTATAAAVTSSETSTVTATAGGGSASFDVQLNPQAVTGTPALSVSATSLSFGDVTIDTRSAPQAVTLTSSGTAPLTIDSAMVTGAGFVETGVGFPVTLNPGETATLLVRFDPTAAGAVTGSIAIASNATATPTTTISLSGTGDATAGVLSGLSCNNATLSGAGNDTCTVSLSAAAPAGGLTVNLSSSDSAVTVPATVTVPANATSASFTLTATAVTSTQSANVIATSGGITKIFALELDAMSPTLSVSTTSLDFGDVNLNTTATQTVTLTSSGTSPVTVSAATLTGTGFAMSSRTLPVTLNPGQSLTLVVTFDPAAAGAASGAITVTSNATNNGTVMITLSGTGQSTAGVLNAVTCSNSIITGAGTDACTVILSAAAPAGGLTVTLSSSNASVTVPASVTVTGGASTATFTATIAEVSSTQAATLTATANGVSKVYDLQLNPQTVVLSLSTSNLNFGDVNLNTPTNLSVTLTSSGTAPLTISSAALSGSAFTMAGATFPVTLNPGQSATLQVTFDPTAAGAMTGSITISSNATANPTATISLSGTGDATAGVLSSLTCTTTTFSAAGTDACTVTLNSAAGTGGLVVTLASDNSAVTVPASVTVAAGATTAPFTATVAAVTSTATATLSATASGVTKTVSLQLSGGTPALTISSTTVAFGDVNLNAPATQTVTLTSSGGAPLTITAISLTGTGFTMSGLTFPLTLNPGETAELDLQFDPTVAGAATGTVTIASNDASGGAGTIALTGTGIATTAYEVQLTWDAPSSSTDPVVGYNIYRAPSGTTTFTLLNTSANSTTAYTDTTVASGSSYTYQVTSVDASGVESTPSNTYTAAIP